VADLGFRIYVTKGELATIMGPLAYGSAKRQLRSGTSPLGETGLDIIEILDENTGIYLDNPEVTALINALAAAGIITAVVRQKVADYVSAQTALPPEITPGVLAPAQHRWRLPFGVDPSDYFTAATIFPEIPTADGYIRVWTDATVSTHPDAVMEV